MGKHTKKQRKTRTNLHEFVIVTSTNDVYQAKDYATLLKTSDIPVNLTEQHDHETEITTIAVMVPEDFLDEAHVIIESQNAYDDFYDLTIDDDIDSDYDANIFEDDF